MQEVYTACFCKGRRGIVILPMKVVNQITILRKMTELARLQQAFRLSDFTRELARQNIIDNFQGKISHEKVDRALQKRLHALE